MPSGVHCCRPRSGGDLCDEYVLIHAAEGWVDRVAAVSIVSPNCMNHGRAGREADAVSDERDEGRASDVPALHEVRIEGDTGHSNASREGGPAVCGLGIEYIETGDSPVCQLAQPAIVPDHGDDSTGHRNIGEELLPSCHVVDDDRGAPADAAVRGLAEEDIRIPSRKIIPDDVDTVVVRRDVPADAREELGDEGVARKRGGVRRHGGCRYRLAKGQAGIYGLGDLDYGKRPG